jgi:hypothetical protein
VELLELSNERNLWLLLQDMEAFRRIFPRLKEVKLWLTVDPQEPQVFQDIIRLCHFSTHQMWIVKVTGFNNSPLS